MLTIKDYWLLGNGVGGEGMNRLGFREFLGQPRWLSGKESGCNVGVAGLIPGWEDPLEKGMATHSSILAWIIPWIEEPGGPQSMESQELDTIE